MPSRKRTIKTRKIAPAVDAKLWDQLTSVARRNGQSQRYVLEQALTHYLRNVVPSQQVVRPHVMETFERTVERNRELLARLAK